MADVIVSSMPVTAQIVISAKAYGPGEGLDILRRKRSFLSGPTSFRIVEYTYQLGEKSGLGPVNRYQLALIAKAGSNGKWAYEYSIYDGDALQSINEGIIMDAALQKRLAIECGAYSYYIVGIGH